LRREEGERGGWRGDSEWEEEEEEEEGEEEGESTIERVKFDLGVEFAAATDAFKYPSDASEYPKGEGEGEEAAAAEKEEVEEDPTPKREKAVEEELFGNSGEET